MLVILPRPLNVSEITVVGLEFKNTRIATNRKRELKVANLEFTLSVCTKVIDVSTKRSQFYNTLHAADQIVCFIAAKAEICGSIYDSSLCMW